MKGRSAVTPIVLVGLAAAAGAYAYLVDPRTVSDADRVTRGRDVFPSFRLDEVRRVELVTGSEVLVLEREPDGGPWAMASPRRERADPGGVDMLLREMEMATRLRDVPPAEALGLDAPRVRGRVAVGALEYRFALGADAPRPDGAAYMKVDREGAFVVGRSLRAQLLRTSDAYRERSLVPYGAGETGRLEVQTGDGAVVLQRNGASFRLETSDGLRASRAAIDRVFAALADARAESFLEDPAAERAAADATFTVTLTPRDASRPRVRLRVGGPCAGRDDDRVVVRTEPTRVSACVAIGSLDSLRVTAAALVDKAPLFAHPDEIEELRLESLGTAGPRIDLARRGGGWHERAPEDRDLGSEEADSVAALAAALSGAQGLDARRGTPGERFEPRARVTIARTGAATSELVEIAAADSEGVVAARRLDDGAILRMPRAVARHFEPHVAALHARDLWDAPFDPGAVVAIDDSCGPTPQRLELRDGTWTLRAPAGFKADAASVADLADALAHAKVDAWVDETDDGSFGLKRAGSCAVTLTLTPQAVGGVPRLVGVEFGAPGEAGVYVRTLGGHAIAVAPEALREMASRPAIDRGRFRLDATTLAQVVLARGGSRLRLSRVGTRLARANASDADLDDGLVVALGGLSAQSALHAGPPTHDEGLDRPTLEIAAIAPAEGGATAETRITIGASTRTGASDAYFARVSGIDATFALPRRAVDAILSAW